MIRRDLLVGLGLVALAAAGACTTPTPDAPKILNVVALRDKSMRSISDGAELRIDELVDFQVELTAPAFVYIFLSEGPHSRLAWGHNPLAPRWETGVYAPQWEDADSGLGFDLPGDVGIWVVASPKQLSNAERAGALDRLVADCPGCGISSAKFKVKPSG